MQNLRWRNLEAKIGFAGSPFMMRRFSETVALRFFPPRKSKAGRICCSGSDIFLKKRLSNRRDNAIMMVFPQYSEHFSKRENPVFQTILALVRKWVGGGLVVLKNR